MQEATASLAAAKGISIEVAVAGVLSEMDGFFTLKEAQRPFWMGCFRFTPVWFWQHITDRSLPRGGTGRFLNLQDASGCCYLAQLAVKI